jgi:hypothetical protein
MIKVSVPLGHLGDGVLVLRPKAVDPRDGPDGQRGIFGLGLARRFCTGSRLLGGGCGGSGRWHGGGDPWHVLLVLVVLLVLFVVDDVFVVVVVLVVA